jgi:hypothetical protein
MAWEFRTSSVALDGARVLILTTLRRASNQQEPENLEPGEVVNPTTSG